MTTTTEIQKTHVFASITRDTALALIEAARAASRDIGIEVAVAVTDAAGHLKAFERSDQAFFLAADVAIDKAWTAASFGLATHVWNSILTDSKVSQLAHRPRMVAVGGGCPIVLGGKVVGAIGISGGNAQQDQQAAEIALKSLGFEVQG
ncbi:heme-binding protein [Variovorax sp. J2P1-59]|uniref:GlcG/HbpS family heme-binding protein n=1 Tax=Variovorax flavidus TaxID=3053501 RepID=UPI002578085A|nr:heme-binding protein [Variovorax sp. J2P1-59]MDM0078652.1 heme-binding protein [Variovorax sp. J2P1-59]